MNDVTREGCEKASPDQFDLLRVLGQGSFGKVRKGNFFFRFEQFNFQMKYPNFYVGNQECNCTPLYMYIVHTQSAKKIRQVPGQKTCEII